MINEILDLLTWQDIKDIDEWLGVILTNENLEEQELYESLKTRLSFYSLKNIIEKQSNASVTMVTYNYYLVTDVSFRNKMKGPYTILDVEVELDKTC